MAKAQDTPSYHTLLNVIWKTKPHPSSSWRASSSPRGGYLKERIDCDEVYPAIFIGDANAAKSKEFLKEMGITHVINTAQGQRIAQVFTNEEYYESSNIRFLGLKLQDTPETNISEYFEECSDFIDKALASGGKVLVHCYMGISRSATIVLAYLMLRKGFRAEDAVRTVRKNRDISPNTGFLQQLCDLDIKLQLARQPSL